MDRAEGEARKGAFDEVVQAYASGSALRSKRHALLFDALQPSRAHFVQRSANDGDFISRPL